MSEQKAPEPKVAPKVEAPAPPPGACGLVGPHDKAEAAKLNPSYEKAKEEADQKLSEPFKK